MVDLIPQINLPFFALISTAKLVKLCYQKQSIYHATQNDINKTTFNITM